MAKNYDDVSEDDLDTTYEEPSIEDAAQPAVSTPDYGIKTPSVRDYLMQKIQAGQSQLAGAQEQSRQNHIGVGIAQALSSGIGSATGAQSPQGLYQDLNQEANAPVANLKASQQNQTDQLKLATQTQSAQQDLDKGDPTSKVSQLTRDTYRNIAKQLGVDMKDYDSLSAADVDEVSKGYLKMEDIKQRAETNRLHFQLLNGIADKKLQASSDKAGVKASEDQKKSYTSMIKDAQSFRGNQAVQQASKDILSANKTLKLIEGKDPNTLGIQDLSLLAHELAKIATGGVPGEHGVETLIPDTLQTHYAKLTSFLSNKPTNAQAGEFIRKNMQYLKEMGQVAQQTVKNYQKNIVDTYEKRVSPEDFSQGKKNLGLSDSPVGAVSKYKPGDTRVINGATYVRGEDGSWTPQ